MFASSMKLLLLLYVCLAHGHDHERHCESDDTCFEAKFTLKKQSKSMIGKSCYINACTMYIFRNITIFVFFSSQDLRDFLWDERCSQSHSIFALWWYWSSHFWKRKYVWNLCLPSKSSLSQKETSKENQVKWMNDLDESKMTK